MEAAQETIYRFLIRTSFDQQKRLKLFGKLATMAIIHTFVLKSLTVSSTFMVWFRWSAYHMVRTGWTLAAITEFLLVARNNNLIFDLIMVLVSMITIFYGNLLSCVLYMILFRFVFWLPIIVAYACIHIRVVLWFVCVFLAILPAFVQVRLSPPGAPNPQFLHLVVWYNRDLCQILNGNWPPNIPPLIILEVHVDPLPWWISTKLSQLMPEAG